MERVCDIEEVIEGGVSAWLHWILTPRQSQFNRLTCLSVGVLERHLELCPHSQVKRHTYSIMQSVLAREAQNSAASWIGD
jgi:hypothetical protein